jgi:hypothetical protein
MDKSTVSIARFTLKLSLRWFRWCTKLCAGGRFQFICSFLNGLGRGIDPNLITSLIEGTYAQPTTASDLSG